ncbi:protein O-mannosyl-transferase TMTC3-like [Clavelina lepadiformis]|uniref:protein O-mannosyl-transferase TMTC3-like n=1 Tax=Clavelina lepadiformis TaxID=159417 RepID=UPI0040430113
MMNDGLFCIIIFVSSFLLYINSCFCELVFDDVSAVQNNKDVLGETSISALLWNDYWGMSMANEASHKSYRPFTVLTYRLNHFVFGLNSFSYHVINVILNCIVCILLFCLFTLLTKVCYEAQPLKAQKSNLKKHIKRKQPQNNDEHVLADTTEKQSFITHVATLVFLVHPIHTEAVTGIVGRAELLSAIFFILAILSYARFTVKSIVLSLFWCVLAVASKEQGITVLAVFIFYDIILVHKLTVDEFCLLLVTFVLSPRKTKFKPLIFRTFLCIFFAVSLLIWRYYIMQGTLPQFTAFDNPAASSQFPARHLTYNYMLPTNLGLLLNPSNLLCDWTMGTIPLIQDICDIRNFATITFWFIYGVIGFCAVFFHDADCKIAAISVAIATFSFLPASNLFFPVGFVVAERVLYLPSIGFCLLVALGVWKIKTKYKCDKLVMVFIVLLLFSFAFKTIHRNTEWTSEKSLFKSALKVTKQNAKVWNNIGHAYEREENYESALQYFFQATLAQPDDIGAFMNVGRMYEQLGDKESAEKFFKKAKALFPKPVKGKPYQARIAPQHLKVYTRLANLIKQNSSRLAEVDALYEEILRMRPSFVDAHMYRGEILVKMNRPKKALLSYQTALQYSENKSDIYFNIGVVYASLGNKTGAVEAYTYAIYHNPDHVMSLYNSAAIFEETREPTLLRKAKSRVERVLNLEPDNIHAKTLLGSIHMDLGDNNEAIRWWNEVLKTEPDQKITLFNIALLYSKIDGKTSECIDAIKRLFQHYPNHKKGLVLYGDVMLNKQKNIGEAQRAYKQLMEVDPGNMQGRHNYCVTLVEQKELKKAEDCFTEAMILAPEANYIKENLALVRNQRALLEASKRGKKEREITNFRQTPVEPARTDADFLTQQQADSVEEEVIYVAQPVKRNEYSLTEQAMKISDDLKQHGNEKSVDKKLEEAMEAVKKLKELKSKADARTEQKCKVKTNVDINFKKKQALKALDELEKLL